VKSENAKSEAIISSSQRRRAGVLLHVTSLPGAYGVGDLGPAAHRWIDLLADAGQSWWQMLPLGPAGEGNSPYRCYSAFAGNPLLISPDLLVEDNLLTSSDLRGPSLVGDSVNYARACKNKLRLLAIAFEAFRKRSSRQILAAYQDFDRQAAWWLEDYALFVSLRENLPGQSWTDWPIDLVRRKRETLRQAREELAGPIDFQKFLQFIFFHQLRLLREKATSRGVGLIGDLPIFVSPESAEVWTHPQLFELDGKYHPRAVAGVPPDLFSATGQRWGNPLYDWKVMAGDGFAWWKRRIASALVQADLVRIDHFRGFESYWRIPAAAPTAQTGRWIKAPGAELFAELLVDDSQMPLLAEDLGIITPEVVALRDRFGLPGMRVLQFGFGQERGNIHEPHHYVKHCFAYTGTHDNDTSAGWYSLQGAAVKRRLKEYAPGSDWDGNAAWSMIQLVHASCADHAIIPAQDLLGLGSRARMNTPGRSDRNWQWRMQSFAEYKTALRRLAKITRIYERDR
jgi:4-alpha-glucanotransferase